YGADESLRFKREEQAANNIARYISRFILWRKIERLTSTIDKKLLKLCQERVKIDFEKMGGEISSDIIDDYKSFTNFISFLYYLSQTNLYRYRLGRTFGIVNQGAMC